MQAANSERQQTIARLRARIERVGSGILAAPSRPRIGFGMPDIDDRLGGGLASGMLHELIGQGADTEHATGPSLLVAGLLAGLLRHDRPDRQVLWAMRGRDLYPPGLAAVGLAPQRLILVESGNSVAAVMEEALRHPGLCAVVGEIEGGFDLTASRRLQLAAGHSGVTAFAIRRSRRFDDPALLAPSAAATRWRVQVLPLEATHRSNPMLLEARARWRLELLRSRSGPSFTWTVQACDADGRLAPEFPERRTPDRLPVPAVLADRSPDWAPPRLSRTG